MLNRLMGRIFLAFTARFLFRSDQMVGRRGESNIQCSCAVPRLRVHRSLAEAMAVARCDSDSLANCPHPANFRFFFLPSDSSRSRICVAR